MRAVLFGALCVITSYALWAIYALGYHVPSLLLIPPATALLWRLRRDRASGAQLYWRTGSWTLEHFGVCKPIMPLRRCTVTPWAIYLTFTDLSSGANSSLWLYADAAPQSQMRQLRVRLTLMH